MLAVTVDTDDALIVVVVRIHETRSGHTCKSKVYRQIQMIKMILIENARCIIGRTVVDDQIIIAVFGYFLCQICNAFLFIERRNDDEGFHIR